ncbi:ABC transporter permease [Legionella jordanis]|uniref:Transport permease protein n=1 Tax=Legionella jordanis TaxID=456 RepID=A0A0W0VES5_9GAMM|nr:ABC transporter permease [Legionella jordanis]KTD18643.1 ABC transporter permease [Legionella jordanis]RMX00847.1 ABC transporter permease [Legionella jordanis]RMX17945.1 ABC transporter permease [Legionella jordanis]VEH11519.1 ABC transporter permease [Legionella jordanis]HAT8715136.1 ABC transporter permease [Legionella jordanis]
MAIKQQSIALYTIVRRELVRMFRIASQVFLPPVITTALYFLIFGSLIGSRIGPVAGVNYPLFIAPGLIMMSVITNAYSNVSTSLFSVRFQKSIEEMLVSPMHDSLLLLGYVLGGVLRGLIVAILVFVVSCFFMTVEFHNILLSLVVVLLVSALFSLAGFTNAMLARNFDDVMIIPTFVLAPLTYLGGVFYTTNMLSPFWQKISHLNPILYMVNALRYAMIGQQEVNILTAMAIICIMVILLAALNMVLLKRGVGLRD